MQSIYVLFSLIVLDPFDNVVKAWIHDLDRQKIYPQDIQGEVLLGEVHSTPDM